MKKLLTFAVVASAIICPTLSFAKSGSHSVKGHTTKQGVYVPPHHATNRDSTTSNNWSHKGNVNPYTGKEGTKN